MTDLSIKQVENDAEWDVVRSIREEIFVVEQECPPEEEWDEFDSTATHFIAYWRGSAVGCARMRTLTKETETVAKLERFAILKRWRGLGLGKRLVQGVMTRAKEAGHNRLYLHAQAHLEALYADLGFEPEGDLFDEAGIPHIAMSLRVDD
ncbi:MAG: GNAT family N-acetyltransferase [Rhodothermales bacterium]|nr:GNAT family N-acetyltransferase [Rhodothermales bacterium]